MKKWLGIILVIFLVISIISCIFGVLTYYHPTHRGNFWIGFFAGYIMFGSVGIIGLLSWLYMKYCEWVWKIDKK